jgi:hypothetical protein
MDEFLFFYIPTLDTVVGQTELQSLTGFPPNTAPSVLASNGIYQVVSTPCPYDLVLYYATAAYTIVGDYAEQSWTAVPANLDEAKAGATQQIKVNSNAQSNAVSLFSGINNETLTGVASLDPVDRAPIYVDLLDSLSVIGDNLAANMDAIDVATSVDEINNIVNKPTGIIFTGRGSGLGPEDLNASYYTEFNSVSMAEADTELYVPGTATVIPYGSYPGGFDSMGNCFNPGDYLIQIRETATSMVIAEFECPLNPAGEDVAF